MLMNLEVRRIFIAWIMRRKKRGPHGRGGLRAETFGAEKPRR